MVVSQRKPKAHGSGGQHNQHCHISQGSGRKKCPPTIQGADQPLLLVPRNLAGPNFMERVSEKERRRRWQQTSGGGAGILEGLVTRTPMTLEAG